MKARPKQAVATTKSLRHRIKTIVESELARLPEKLDGFTAKERVEVLMKLMPLVVPRPKPVHHREGESSDWASFL